MAESATEIKLFGKWSLDDVEINDISLVVRKIVLSHIVLQTCDNASVITELIIAHLNLQDFIAVKGKHATFVAHTAGRYQRKRFRKAQVQL